MYESHSCLGKAKVWPSRHTEHSLNFHVVFWIHT